MGLLTNSYLLRNKRIEKSSEIISINPQNGDRNEANVSTYAVKLSNEGNRFTLVH